MSTKWVARSSEPSKQGTVSVDPDSTTVLASFPPRPVNFVTIFGPAKSGKSFFMNALARKDGIFGVSPAAVPCTAGVDLSQTVVSLGEFTGTVTAGQSESTPCIGFVDVEGLGDRDLSHHVKLAIPPMLASKVIILNLKDVQRATVLDTLAVLESAARAVASAESQQVYGHLIVLVRDTFDQADGIHHLVFGLEEPGAGASQDDVVALNLRNSTRRKLKRVFQDIKVWCLPLPHSDINDNKVFALSDLKPEFHAKLDGLRRYMGQVLNTPHIFGGSEIIGRVTLQPLMTRLCDAVSTCKAVQPVSMMEGVEIQVAGGCSKDGAKKIKVVLENLGAAVWSVEAVENKLGKARVKILGEFEEATKDLQERAVKGAKEALEGRIEGQVNDFRRAMEMKRKHLDGCVRRLNERAFTLVEHEALSMQLPVDDFAAKWSTICDRAFAYLEGTVACSVEDEALLPHVPAVLDRGAFGAAVQDKYQRFEQRNSWKRRLENLKMDRMEEDRVMQKVESGRNTRSQSTEHSKQLAKLEDALGVSQNRALGIESAYHHLRRQQQIQEHHRRQQQDSTVMENTRIKLDKCVRRLNKKAYARVEQEASTIQLPVDDLEADWSDICDRAFAILERDVACYVRDKYLLTQVSALIDRGAFELAVRGTYKRIGQCNILEKQLKNCKMEKMDAECAIRRLATRATEQEAESERNLNAQKAASERRLNAQAMVHRKEVAKLEDALRVSQSRALGMENAYHHQTQQQQEQQQQEQHQHEQQRTAREITRLKLEQRVRRLNEEAFALVEQKASAIQLPVDDLSAGWNNLCDQAFANLEETIFRCVEDKGLLEHVPARLSRVAFEEAVQEKYKHVEQCNILEKRVKHAEMERKAADKANQQMERRAAEEREDLKRTPRTEATEDSKQLAELEEDVRVYPNVAREMGKINKNLQQQQPQQQFPALEAGEDEHLQLEATPTRTLPALSSPTTTSQTPTPRRSVPLLSTMVIMWNAVRPTMGMTWDAALIVLAAAYGALAWLADQLFRDDYRIVQHQQQQPQKHQYERQQQQPQQHQQQHQQHQRLQQQQQQQRQQQQQQQKQQQKQQQQQQKQKQQQKQQQQQKQEQKQQQQRRRQPQHQQQQPEAGCYPIPGPAIPVVRHNKERARNSWNDWQKANKGRHFDITEEKSEAYQREKHLFM